MTTPYKEEWQGRGERVHVELDDINERSGPYFDFKIQQWRCRCEVFNDERRCKHVYYFRRQETVEVNGKYL
jgi:hypothetical protein